MKGYFTNTTQKVKITDSVTPPSTIKNGVPLNFNKKCTRAPKFF